jgi:LysM repeat protein
MNSKVFTTICLLGLGAATSRAQQTNSAPATSLEVLDEKLSRLTAQIEDLQFRQKQTEDALKTIKTDLSELRKLAGNVTAADLTALEKRLDALDAARQKDKQAIIDTVAKELAALAGGGPKPGTKDTGSAKEHLVEKSETLTSVARQYGVTVASLRKANNLTTDTLHVGQKLIIPPK